MHGLLQTPEYAAALLAVDEPDRVEEMVAAPDGTAAHPGEEAQAPAVWVIFDESVLFGWSVIVRSCVSNSPVW
ncbi:Scr1 family TA system antitoxin-like transcriptional regulator [Streptomyces sp. L7]